jgi:hypothetical protein
MPQQTFYPVIPQIAQAYQNDPRTKLAAQALQAGGDTSPTAGGKWAWLSGLSRVGSGIVGGIEQKQQERKYNDKQQQVMDEVAAALGGGAAGPEQGGGGMAPPQGVQSVQPPPPPMVPQAPPQAAPAPSGPQGGPTPPLGLQAAPTGFDGLGRGAPAAPVPGRSYNPADAVAELGMDPTQAQAQYGHVAQALSAPGGSGAPAGPFSQPSPHVQGADLVRAMIPITALTESRGTDFTLGNKPVTSPKGAKYAMQVMPATARNPGFGIKPAASDSPAEYDRVGQQLIAALTEKYGDPAKAWAAYNCGTGRVDHALTKHGDGWLAALPAETRSYVEKNCAALGISPDGTPAAAGGDQTMTPQLQPLPATDRPEIPGLPAAPQDRGAAQSLSLSAGRKLLNTKDPFLYEQAMEMLTKGQGEQFGANQKSLDVLNGRDNALYNAGIDDHFNAAQADRNDRYATGREMRGYAHEDNQEARREAFSHNERVGTEQFDSGENQKNRDSEWQRTKYTVDGRQKTEEEKRAEKRQNFFQTPQGAKLYGETSDTVNNNNSLSGLVDNFMEYNGKQQDTGGLVLNSGVGSGISRALNSNLRTMDSITHQLAPMIRQKGQGSMSDRDLEMFERAIPNIANDYKTNVARAQQFKSYVSRMNDFETHKLQAAADGSNVQFLKSWEMYKNAVPVSSGKSYDDWIASIPHYDASGKKL